MDAWMRWLRVRVICEMFLLCLGSANCKLVEERTCGDLPPAECIGACYVEDMMCVERPADSEALLYKTPGECMKHGFLWDARFEQGLQVASPCHRPPAELAKPAKPAKLAKPIKPTKPVQSAKPVKKQSQAVHSKSVTVCELIAQPNVKQKCSSLAAQGKTACQSNGICAWKEVIPASCRERDDLIRQISLGQKAPTHGQPGPVQSHKFLCEKAYILVDRTRVIYVMNYQFNFQMIPPAENRVSKIAWWDPTAAVGNQCKPMFIQDICKTYFGVNKKKREGMSQKKLCEQGLGVKGETTLRRPKFIRMRENGYWYLSTMHAGSRMCDYVEEQPGVCEPSGAINPCVNIQGSAEEIEKKCGNTPETQGLCKPHTYEAK